MMREQVGPGLSNLSPWPRLYRSRGRRRKAAQGFITNVLDYRDSTGRRFDRWNMVVDNITQSFDRLKCRRYNALAAQTADLGGRHR